MDRLKQFRQSRERLYRYTHPYIRPLDLAKDAWILWAAYDLGSFPVLKKGMKPEEFFTLLRTFLSAKSSALIVDEDHKYFRDKRGPVAIVWIDNYGWRIEPQVDFFLWAKARNRIAAIVSFLQMARYAKEVGVCVVRVAQKDVALCDHVMENYDLLRPYGQIPNAGPYGKDYLYGTVGRRKPELRVIERQAA